MPIQEAARRQVTNCNLIALQKRSAAKEGMKPILLI